MFLFPFAAPAPGILSRSGRVLALLLCLVVAGCQSMNSKDAESENARHAASLQQEPEWLEATIEQPPQDIWERLREGFKLQDEIGVNPRIENQRLWFVSNPSFLERASLRGSRYIHYVVERLEERDMPMELALLPVIESAYNPYAYSRSHAVGLWQFIPSTGRYYNLRQTNWYDGRRDITASTSAALSYLSRLHDMFNGDWLLALAAYNAGEGTVSRAIERNQRLGLPTDYWNLPLPKETQDYVPKLLALSQIVQSPEAYGVTLNPIANEPYFEQVASKPGLDLARIAALVDMDEDELESLNPAFKRGVTLDGPLHLLVPTDKAELFSSSLAQMKPQELQQWQDYRVRSGDSLHSIANRHQITISELKAVNKLKSNRLRVGQMLSIPGKGVREAPTQQTAAAVAKAAAPRNYRVKSGDTLWQIANAHKVPLKDLQRWNGLNSHSKLRTGQTLKIHGAQPQVAKASSEKTRQKVTYYRVKRGDSMFQIAQRFNVDVKRLQSWNPGNGGQHLQPGQTLTLYLD